MYILIEATSVDVSHPKLQVALWTRETEDTRIIGMKFA